MHYLRAFFTALGMTLRGEQIRPQHPELTAWARETVRLVDAVYRAAETSALDRVRREQLILHLDKRDVSMETILATVRHHAAEEYMYLLRDTTPHTVIAVQASNLNDRYWVSQLCEAVRLAPVQAAVAVLARHLEAIPTEEAVTICE